MPILVVSFGPGISSNSYDDETRHFAFYDVNGRQKIE